MSRMAVEMLTDIEKDTIDWDPNFDETKKEPSVLPCRFPNLLVNGSQGIAVGMATNIPPHNLSEVIDAASPISTTRTSTCPALMEYIKARTSPLPASSWAAAASALLTPRAAAKSRCGAVPKSSRKRTGRYEILINEIPYMVNKTRLIESIADLVKDKRIEASAT